MTRSRSSRGYDDDRYGYPEDRRERPSRGRDPYDMPRRGGGSSGGPGGGLLVELAGALGLEGIGVVAERAVEDAAIADFTDALRRAALSFRPLTPEERAEAIAFLKSPNLVDRVAETFEACGLVGEEVNRLAAYLACTSRKLARPLAVIIQSTSAAGKSTLIKCVSGVHHPDGGHIFFEGREVHFSRPIEARKAGIETIYQDLALAGNLDVSAVGDRFIAWSHEANDVGNQTRAVLSRAIVGADLPAVAAARPGRALPAAPGSSGGRGRPRRTSAPGRP